MRKPKIHAFTLVELIIVITILAILATISFLSFQSYTKDSRDANRLASIVVVKKAIDIFKEQTGILPMVDNKIGTGTINATAVTHVGYVGDNVVKLIKMDKVPLDPSTGGKYIYGIDATLQKYQIGTVVESLQTSKYPLYSQTYADGGIMARVVGNYNGLLIYNNKIYNIPSLIITFSGTTNQDLLTGSTNYVIDKGGNLPYLVAGASQLNTLTATGVLQKLLSTGATVSITGVNLPTDAAGWNAVKTSLQGNLGYNIDAIGTAVFGNDYFLKIKNSNDVVNSNCTAGQGFNGTSCVAATGCNSALQSITLSNGQTWSCMNVGATSVWDGTTPLNSCGGMPTNCNTTFSWLGNYYQRGRNEKVLDTTPISTYNGTFSGLLGHNTFVLSEAAYGDWWQNEAGSGTSTRWSGVNPQGPCDAGWHVPSQAERVSACNTISGNSCANSAATVTSLQSVLKLPLGGLRYQNSGNYSSQGVFANYWLSSTSGANSLSIYFNTTSIFSNSPTNRGYGLNVRCIKN